MFDYHMHSDFSADSDTPMETTIEKAISLGLEEICFTDHIDYDYPDKDWIFEFDLKAYDQKIRKLQEVYADKIRIKKGLEIGLQPHLLERYQKLMEAETFDFVICSMHSVAGHDLHSGGFMQGKTTEEGSEIYYKELLDCIKKYKEFSILGHVDLIKRYTKEKSNYDFHNLLSEIFKEIIPHGLGIELNTSGFRYGLESGMPSRDILTLYKECGGEILTIGSDAHTETALASHFTESLELIEEIGFKYIATFDNMQPKFHSISSLKGLS